MSSHTMPLIPKRVIAVLRIVALLIASALVGAAPAALALALAARVAQAQGPRHHPASDPAAIALYERHARATGAATPPEFQHSIVETRIDEGPVMRTETFVARPDLIRVTTTVGGQPFMEYGYDGTTGWGASPVTGLILLTKDALENMRASASALATVALDSTSRATAIGRSTFDDQPVDGVRAITAAGDTAEIYYAVSTGLMAGLRMRSARDSAANLTLLMRDYKRVGGRMAHMTSITRGSGMEIVARTIRLDFEPIEAARFRPPPGVPAPPST